MDVLDTLMYYVADEYLCDIDRAYEALSLKIREPKAIVKEDVTLLNETVSGKMFDIWVKQFKPKWKELKRLYSGAQTPKEQSECLWLSKKLILETRDTITGIKEDRAMNIVMFILMLELTFGIAIAGYITMGLVGVKTINNAINRSPYKNDVLDFANNVGTRGLSVIQNTLKENGGTVTDNIAREIATNPATLDEMRKMDRVSAGIKDISERAKDIFEYDSVFWKSTPIMSAIAQALGFYYLAMKNVGYNISKGNSDLLRNQKFKGSMPKQYAVAKLNRMLVEVDQKLEELNAGNHLAVDRRAKEFLSKRADKYVDSLIAKYTQRTAD